MPNVITPIEWYEIADRYDQSGWLTQRDQDRLENTVWWSNREVCDLRIPGHELSEWFDDFYAYIDKDLPDRKVPKRRVLHKPKPKPKVKYPSEKDLSEDEDVAVWSEPIRIGQDLRKALENFDVQCPGHTMKLQVNHDGHCRIICTACNRSIELLQVINLVLTLAPDMIREMGGIIWEDGTFCFPVSKISIAIPNQL